MLILYFKVIFLSINKIDKLKFFQSNNFGVPETSFNEELVKIRKFANSRLQLVTILQIYDIHIQCNDTIPTHINLIEPLTDNPFNNILITIKKYLNYLMNFGNLYLNILKKMVNNILKYVVFLEEDCAHITVHQEI